MSAFDKVSNRDPQINGQKVIRVVTHFTRYMCYSSLDWGKVGLYTSLVIGLTEEIVGKLGSGQLNMPVTRIEQPMLL